MKILCFLLFTLIAATLADIPQEKLKKLSNDCKSESGVSEESLNKVRNNEEVNDPKLKEYGLCVLKKEGFINDNGELQIETIRTKFRKVSDNDEGVENLVKKCAVQKDTPQNTAANFIKCERELAFVEPSQPRVTAH